MPLTTQYLRIHRTPALTVQAQAGKSAEMTRERLNQANKQAMATAKDLEDRQVSFLVVAVYRYTQSQKRVYI